MTWWGRDGAEIKPGYCEVAKRRVKEAASEKQIRDKKEEWFHICTVYNPKVA